MDHLNAVWSHNKQNQLGHGRSSSRSIHSVDNQPRVNVGVDVVTPAQAYASVMRTGQSHNRALYHTIERRQPEEKGKVPESQFGPPQLCNPHDPKSSERGPSFAQRLYASALSNRNPTLPSSNISITPIGHASSSAPTGVPRGVPLHKPDTNLEDLRAFNPNDLYRGHAATQGLLSRGSALPEASSTHHSSLNTSSATHLTYSTISRASGSSSQTAILKSEARQVPHSFQSVSMETLSSRNAACNTRVSGVPEVSAGTHHLPAIAGEAIPSLSPLLPQFLGLPSPSSPPFGRHVAPSSLPGESVADIPPLITQLPASISHEEVPSYSLVDEQLPPPAFDDLRIELSATETHPEGPPVVPNQAVLPERMLF